MVFDRSAPKHRKASRTSSVGVNTFTVSVSANAAPSSTSGFV